MDKKDEIKKDAVEETVELTDETSMEDMMAVAVEESSEPKDEAATEEAADQIQDSSQTPMEETEVTDPTPIEGEVAVEEETPTETATDMIEEAAADSAEEALTPTDEKIQPSLPAPKVYRGKWYIVHTYSGHENKVAKTLMQRVQAMGFEERIFDALVPTRDTIRVRGGKKETIKEKIFPGYILVNMDLSDEAWVLVRTTPGVTSFVGAQNKPTPIRDDEVQAIIAFVGQKDPVYKAQFSNGEAVKITDGPFSDFLGTVESIDEAKGKIKVLVSIFGRETPVELDFLQVAKI